MAFLFGTGRIGRALAAIAAFVCAGNVSAATDALNLTDALSGVRSSMAAGQVGNVVVLGDSISFRDGSYLYPFRQMLQNQYGDAGTGWQGMSLFTGAGFDSYGVAWANSGTINQDIAPYHSLDGLWATSSTGPYNPPSQPLPYTGAIVDAEDQHVQVQFATGPGGGSFQVYFPDGTTRTISTAAAANGVGTLEYVYPNSLTPTARRLWFQPQGDGPVTLLGENNTTGNGGIIVHRAANGGWGVRNFLQRDYTFDTQLGQLHPDLVMIWLGQNDLDLALHQQFQGEMSRLIDRLQADIPAAKILLVSSYDTGLPESGTESANELSLASARHLGFINIYDLAGSYQSLITRGYIDTSQTPAVHPTPAGGQYLATILYQEWETDGNLQLVGDANHDGSVGFDDLVALAQDFGKSAATWQQGDFNGDGKVDFSDLVLLARDYGQGPTSTQLAQLDPQFRADVQAAFAEIPEPACLSLACVPLLLVVRRRSRR